jgi:hypothetical protein
LQAVLYPALPADRLADLLGVAGEAAEEGASFAARRAGDRALGLDHPDAAQPRPARAGGEVGDGLRLADRPAAARLDAAVPLLRRLPPVVGDPLEPVRLGVGESGLDRLLGRRLVALEGQDVVAPVVDDLLGDRRLAAHGVERDDAAFQRQQAQQLRQGDDLVRLVVDLDLAQDQPVVGRPGADEVDGRLAVGPVVRAAQRLAVMRHDPAGRQPARGASGHRQDPAEEAALEPLGVERREDAPEGVVRWDAVGERQEGAQPGELGAPERVHVGPPLRAADDGAQRDRDDVEQLVPLGVVAPRVGQRGEVGADVGVERRPHAVPPAGRSATRTPPVSRELRPPDHRSQDAIALGQYPSQVYVRNLVRYDPTAGVLDSNTRRLVPGPER